MGLSTWGAAWWLTLTLASAERGAIVECTDLEHRARERAEALLGRPIALGELVVRVDVEVVDAVGFGARLELEYEGAIERRALQSDSCEALADAVALLVAVILDPAGPPIEVVPEPRVDTVPVVAATQAASAVTDARARASPPIAGASGAAAEPPVVRAKGEKSVRVALGVGGGAESGAIPGGTGGVRAWLAIDRGAFRLMVSGDDWIRRSRRSLPRGAGVVVGLAVGALRGCGTVRRGRWTIPFCGGIEAGAMLAEGVGLAPGRRVVSPWVAALGSTGIEVGLGRWIALTAIVEPFVPLVRPVYGADPADGGPITAYRPAAVGVRGLLGVAVRFDSLTERVPRRESPL